VRESTARSRRVSLSIRSIGYWRKAKLPWAKNDNGSYSGAPASKMGHSKRWAALSSRRQDLIDQPIVRCFERIDKSNTRQFKAILEVLGKQMANTGPLCCAP
jgi:hypothetical protein